MISAAKKKMPLSGGITAFWISLLLAVVLCLPETRLWNFKTTFHSVSVKISYFHSVAVGQKQVVWDYDASDTAYPLLGDVAKAGVKALHGAPASLTTSIGDLRATGLKDAHHVIQDAAVRDLSGYSSHFAPGVQLRGPSTLPGSPHYIATQVQRQSGGGTYAAERRIGYKALRQAGYSEAEGRQIIDEVDRWFQNIGVGPTTPTRIPGNRN